MTSAEVAAAVGAGVRRVCPDATVVPVPVADGGDGTLAAAVGAGFTLVPIVASGPTGSRVHSGYARRNNTAVVELADVSGLVRLPEGRRAPMTATTYGTGELIAAAIDAGCTRIILGIGGSASTDGGTGLIQALAAPRPFTHVETTAGVGEQAIACSPTPGVVAARLEGVEVVVACDVDNPLTGPRGAAAVYGPQKGATPEQVVELDGRLSAWADEVAEHTGRDLRDVPGAGAAGGVGFAALALLGAELRPGIELVLEMVGFEQQLAGADLVITGEGALDEQTLHGKAVAGVAAAGTGIPVVAVCGVNRLEAHQLQDAGVRAAYALTDLEPDVQRCIAEPEPLLERLGERIAIEHLTMTRRERGGG
ncbi:glycerate kinase family protein [Kribbella kalugense]|uniref:glycerate kinase n=1 Tax=Kribbella kalugense TaxID=2512221 RepID=UPI001EDFF7F7